MGTNATYTINIVVSLGLTNELVQSYCQRTTNEGTPFACRVILRSRHWADIMVSALPTPSKSYFIPSLVYAMIVSYSFPLIYLYLILQDLFFLFYHFSHKDVNLILDFRLFLPHP